jgi:hypothetical protein
MERPATMRCRPLATKEQAKGSASVAGRSFHRADDNIFLKKFLLANINFNRYILLPKNLFICKNHGTGLPCQALS